MPERRRDGSSVAERSPARGYTWPPFQEGNTIAVRHGAWSDRLASQRAQGVLAELVERYPWIEDADVVVLDVLVKAKARYDALDEYAAAVIEGDREAYPRKGSPLTGPEAVPDKVLTALARLENTIIQAAGKLGLTATDRAQLFKDAGMAKHFGGDPIAKLVERGRQLREGGTSE
jgi:hypothetical protein